MKDQKEKKLLKIYRKHRQHLYSYALSLTQNRENAEDAVQKTFLNLLKRNELPEDLKPYVFRCVRNAALQKRRDESKNNYASVFNLQYSKKFSNDRFTLEELDAFFMRISKDEKETILLKIIAGFTFKEIAALKEASINTAASWYRRGLMKLREIMEEKNR